MEQKQIIIPIRAKIRRVEKDYIICRLQLYAPNTMIIKDKTGKKITIKDNGFSDELKIKFDKSNNKLLHKLEHVDRRKNQMVKYKAKLLTKDPKLMEIVDIVTDEELEENNTYLFYDNNILSSTIEKTRYKTYIQRGTDVIKKQHIKGISNTTIKYTSQRDLYNGITFVINEIPEEMLFTEQLFKLKGYKEQTINEFIELLKQEEAEGINTYVVVKTRE